MPVFPNNVSLRQLRAFDEVARQGAFAPAARELCLTQSALSESIRQLEEALGEAMEAGEVADAVIAGVGVPVTAAEIAPAPCTARPRISQPIWSASAQIRLPSKIGRAHV